MPQFQFDRGLRQPDEAQPPGREGARALAGPRLVGGTGYAPDAGLSAAQVQHLAQACLTGLDAARQVVFGWQRLGLPLALIYTSGLAPCARLLGQWWGADRIDFALTTIASTHLQELLHEFHAEFLSEEPVPPQNLSVLLLTEPGAQHSLGLFMLGQFFRRAGWSVTLAVPADVGEFERSVCADWFDAVGVSVSTDRHLLTLETLLPRLKATSVNPAMHIFIGGPMALLAPQRLQWQGAQLLAEEAPAAVRRVSACVLPGRP